MRSRTALAVAALALLLAACGGAPSPDRPIDHDYEPPPIDGVPQPGLPSRV